MNQFQLHPQLASDTVSIMHLDLCQILLMNDRAYPWLVMVPRRGDMREMHDLSPGDQQTLMDEITKVSRTVQRLFKADKMNVAALGNMVPQLHVHVIARFEIDAAWPGPIWGVTQTVPYGSDALVEAVQAIKTALS